METSKSLYELCSIEAGSALTKLLILTQMVEQLTAIKEVHDEVQFSGSLEGIVKFDDEWAVNFLQNIPLS